MSGSEGWMSDFGPIIIPWSCDQVPHQPPFSTGAEQMQRNPHQNIEFNFRIIKTKRSLKGGQ